MLDYAGFLTATLQRLDYSDNAEDRFLKEVDHAVYTAGKRKLIHGDVPEKEKVKSVKNKVEGKVLKSSSQFRFEGEAHYCILSVESISD